MVDFMLTKTGDIVMSESQRQRDSRSLFFNINNGSSAKFSFYIDNSPEKITSDKMLVSFSVVKDIKAENEIMTIKNKRALKQMVYNIIYTAKNELKINKTFGSRMEEVKHHQIFDENTINRAEKFLSEALFNIIPYAKIIVEPDYEIKPKFKQGLRIVITNEGEEMFNEII